MSKGMQLVKVPFHGDEIEAVKDGDGVWVSVRRVCEALGVSTQGQQAKLAVKPWATIKTVLSVADDGKTREAFCLHLDSLPMWLATIEPSRTKAREEIQAKLARYQIECARVLRDHFFGARDVKPPAPPMLPAIAGIVRESNALRFDLRRWMFAAAKVHRVHFGRVAGWIAREFGVASYLRLPIPVGVYVRDRLTRIVAGEEGQPFGRRALPPSTGQVVFPPPVGPSPQA